jgi:hypothetical protein
LEISNLQFVNSRPGRGFSGALFGGGRSVYRFRFAALLLSLFAPFFVADDGVLDEKIERLAVTQSVGDATFAPLLCQGGSHLLNRLPLPFRKGLDFGVDLLLRDLDILRLGQCASMGALLLTSGAKGKRFALPNSRILIHQPSIAGGIGGQASDIKIQAEEIIRMRELTSSIIAKHTGQPFDQVERDVERDRIMSATQAKEYGLIDEVITHRQ